MYNFKIRKSEGNHSVHSICQSYLQDIRDVLQSGKCVILYYGTVLEDLGDNKSLLCEIEVLRSGAVNSPRQFLWVPLCQHASS
jgi:hypothetical protein